MRRRIGIGAISVALVLSGSYALLANGASTVTFDWNAAYQAAQPGDCYRVDALSVLAAGGFGD